MTDEVKRAVLEAALIVAEICHDTKRAMEPKDADTLAGDLLNALNASGWDIAINHQWTLKTPGGKDKCAKCGLLRVALYAGNTHLGYSFYRRGTRTTDDLGGVTPPCKK